jgi:membrane-associated phospholipid phosphatase
MAAVNSLQIVVNEFFQAFGAWLTVLMSAITFLGDEEFYVLLLPILYWSFDQIVGLRVGMMLLLSNGFNTFFKFLFRTPRPSWVSDTVVGHVHESSFGLPSGHAQNAASVWGWMAVEVKQRWFTIVMLVLIFLIGVSRMVLGVHFLGDVLLGWLIGGLLVLAFASWFQKVGHWFEAQTFGTRLGLVVASTAVLMLLILVVYWAVGTSWVMNPDWAVRVDEGVDPFNLNGTFTLGGTWLGMLGGFVILSEKKGRFLAGEGGWQRLMRFLIGFLGLATLYFGLGRIFPRGANFASYSLRFVRYTLVGLWISWIGPLVFEGLGMLKFKEK